MTGYQETVGKRSNWTQRQQPQTGLLPAVPALGSIAGYAGGALSLGSAAALGSKLLGVGGKAAKAGGSAGKGLLTSGSLGGLAKAGVGAYALNEFSSLMQSGPKIAGVGVIPLVAVGGSALVTGKLAMDGNFNPFIMLPAAGVGILAAMTQF